MSAGTWGLLMDSGVLALVAMGLLSALALAVAGLAGWLRESRIRAGSRAVRARERRKWLRHWRALMVRQ